MADQRFLYRINTETHSQTDDFNFYLPTEMRRLSGRYEGT